MKRQTLLNYISSAFAQQMRYKVVKQIPREEKYDTFFIFIFPSSNKTTESYNTKYEIKLKLKKDEEP